MNNKARLFLLFSVAVIVLLIPFIAMRFTNEVRWTISDFLSAAVLLFCAAATIEFIMRKMRKSETRIISIILSVVALILVWLELAVGIFHTPLSGS